ncbi:PASTA domain-containing protein [Fannyhessea vaginae]|uniref:PASTA domain-containing protein n=1 Tax=Fannyhessea vaginae TaxID=82135 RepID=UPI0023F17567|nr:PASTA domain-containing protein [Fannyhessea vaginae]
MPSDSKKHMLENLPHIHMPSHNHTIVDLSNAHESKKSMSENFTHDLHSLFEIGNDNLFTRKHIKDTPEVSTHEDTDAQIPESDLYVPATYQDMTTMQKSAVQNLKDLPFLLKAIAIALVCSILISSTILTQCFGILKGQTMDNYVGVSVDEATAELQSKNLTVKVEEQTTTLNDQIGKVIATTPSSGENVMRGSTVVLKVGKLSQDSREVPSFIGLTEQDALKAIADTSFFVKDHVEYEENSQAAKGTVMAQDPVPGTLKTKGSSIKLYIAQ